MYTSQIAIFLFFFKSGLVFIIEQISISQRKIPKDISIFSSTGLEDNEP